MGNETTSKLDRRPTQSFLDARDFLLRHRDNYEVAYWSFHWPQLDRFNWALDVFDVLARDNHTPALWVVKEDGCETKLSYAQMSARSNQVANFLRGLGVKRCDRILLVLPNCVPLWEATLATIKLGAVIVPTTLLVTPEELAERVQRGGIRFVIAMAVVTDKLSTVPGAVTGWQRFEDAYLRSTDSSHTALHRRPIRSCCISPRAPPPSPSWCYTASKAIRSATSPRCTG